MKIIKGDLIQLVKQGEFDAIVHGCNCFCTMGSGIAKQIKDNFPIAYQIDQRTTKGDKRKLGTITSVRIDDSLLVVNAYTQFTYGRGKDLFEYEAFGNILSTLNVISVCFKGLHGKDLRWGMPLIGCGLAGGDKDRILGMIETKMKGCDVTVVEYENTKQ